MPNIVSEFVLFSTVFVVAGLNFFFLIELVSGLKLSPGTRVFFPDCHALGRVDFLVSQNAHTGFELKIPWCWDYRCVPSHLAFHYHS